jgi:hypothetical protein
MKKLGPGKWCWVYGGEPKVGRGSAELFFWTGTREGAWVQANELCQRRFLAEGPLVPFVDLAIWHPGAGVIAVSSRFSDGEHHTFGGAPYCPICCKFGLPGGDP